MKLENIKKIDYELSYKIAKFLKADSPLRILFQLATISGTAFFWFILIPIWYYFLNGENEAITFGFITSIMIIPVFLIKQSVRRKRPDFKDTRFGAVVFDKWSFPSGHATRSTYVVILMSIYMPEFLIFWVIWAIIMITSRLILGVHYVSDIIAGMLLGSIAMITFHLIGWLPIIPWDIAGRIP